MKMDISGNNMNTGIMSKGCDYMMNKAVKMTLLCFALFAAALMIITLVITSAVRGVSVDSPAVLTEAQYNSSYWVRSYNGHIAVYNQKADVSPMIETTIAVEGLRGVDKDMLENGIEATSYEEVLKLLEDFGS